MWEDHSSKVVVEVDRHADISILDEDVSFLQHHFTTHFTTGLLEQTHDRREHTHLGRKKTRHDDGTDDAEEDIGDDDPEEPPPNVYDATLNDPRWAICHACLAVPWSHVFFLVMNWFVFLASMRTAIYVMLWSLFAPLLSTTKSILVQEKGKPELIAWGLTLPLKILMVCLGSVRLLLHMILMVSATSENLVESDIMGATGNFVSYLLILQVDEFLVATFLEPDQTEKAQLFRVALLRPVDMDASTSLTGESRYIAKTAIIKYIIFFASVFGLAWVFVYCFNPWHLQLPPYGPSSITAISEGCTEHGAGHKAMTEYPNREQPVASLFRTLLFWENKSRWTALRLQPVLAGKMFPGVEARKKQAENVAIMRSTYYALQDPAEMAYHQKQYHYEKVYIFHK